MDISLALKCSKMLTAQTSLSLVHMTPKCLPLQLLFCMTNKVATTRQATHLEGETCDIVRDLFSALSFEKKHLVQHRKGDFRNNLCNWTTAYVGSPQNSIYTHERNSL